MKKAAGLDVNGWRDHVARNWTTLPGDDTAIEGIHVGSGGPLTSVVQIGEGKTARWIGGQPADLAPHGKGGGWGRIGDPARRLVVRDLLDGRAGEATHLAAAFTDFVKRTSHTVLAIEDSPDTTETMRERLLNGMTAARCGSPTLVWRTVLAALHAIDTGLLRETCTIGVVSHVTAGLSVQKLRIRAEGSRSGILTPERKAVATILKGDAGLRGLVTQIRHAALEADGFSARTMHRTVTRTVGRVALGMLEEPEIVRLDGGGWEIVTAPERPPLPTDLSGDVPDLSDCAQIFLETITEGRTRSDIKALVHARGLRIDTVLLPDAVARGALVAAQRMATGEPVYFDFLPRISTIVFGKKGAENYDLIDETETLEAGRIYRSSRPAILAIPKEKSEVSVYLRKDAEARPRKATVTLKTAPSVDVPVSVWVEQKPAAGSARIVMEAPSLSRNFQLSWDAADEDDRTWDEIIAALATPPPPIPDRLVLECGLEAWKESSHLEGMADLLDSVTDTKAYDWKLLAQKAAARTDSRYSISSDGILPEGLTTKAIQALDEAVQRALAITKNRLDLGPQLAARENAALQFLTWQFRRCPPQVSGWLLNCVENHAGRNGTHPFTWVPGNWPLIYQGLGRTVHDPELEKNTLRTVLDNHPSTWNWRCESACVSFLLSRSETAPVHLGKADIEIIGARAIFEFENAIGSRYTTFNYAPFLIGGLLRYRLKEPFALIAGQDPLADALIDAIENTLRDLNARAHSDLKIDGKRQKYAPILDDLLRYLNGEVGSPDLLKNIYFS